MPQSISVVIPVFNNAGSLTELVQRLNTVSQQVEDAVFEFIFVDDGSADESIAVLTALQSKDAKVRIIKLTRNFGEGGAILAGFHAARGDLVGTMAADLQEAPEHLLDMIDKLRSGHSLVLGIREDRADPSLCSSLFYWLMRRFVFADYPAGGFDTSFMTRGVLDNLLQNCPAGSLPNVTLVWLGYPYAVTRIKREVRRHGKSQYNLGRKFTFLLDSLSTFSAFPLRAMSFLGAGVAMGGFMVALVIIIDSLSNGIEVPGWTSLMVLLCLLQGTVLLLLGVMGEYLWRTLAVSRARPPFVVEKEVRCAPSDMQTAEAIQPKAHPARDAEAARAGESCAMKP